jgi:hypothetical protein
MNCGQELPDEAKFCLNCGTAVTPIQYVESTVSENVGPVEAEPEGDVLPTEEPPPPPRKYPKWVPFAAGGFLLILLAVVLVLVLPRKTDDEPAAASVPSPSAVEPTATPLTVDYSDLELPVPGEGESLYVGEMSFPQTERAAMAFVLSADGSEIHDLTIYLKKLELDLSESASVSGMSVTETYNTSFARNADPIQFGPSTLSDLAIDGDYATLQLDYVYTHTGLGGTEFTEIPLGNVTVELVRITVDEPYSASTTETAEPVSTPIQTASVQFEDTTYVLSIGEFGIDEDGDQTIEVNCEGVGAVLSFRDGGIVIPVHMMCLCGEEYVHSLGVSISRDSLVYAFDPDIEPELLILYPDGAQDDPAQWAVYSIEEGGFLPEY